MSQAASTGIAEAARPLPPGFASPQSRLDPHAARFLGMVAAGRATSPNIADRRESLARLARLAAWPVGGVTAKDTAFPGSSGPVAVRLYAPAQAAPGPAPAVLYLHGGGLVSGSLDTHDDLCRQLAAASGAQVVSVGYRLAPEHPLPAAVEDAQAALFWMYANAEALGLDPARLAVAGDSAGAWLAAKLCRTPEARRIPLAAQLLICPIADVEGDTPSRRLFGEGYFLDAETIRGDARACGAADGGLHSLLSGGDLSRLPPTLIHTAECDIVRDDGALYADRLAAAGVPVRLTCHPGMIHYFYALGRLIPKSRLILQAIGGELAQALRRPAPASNPASAEGIYA